MEENPICLFIRDRRLELGLTQQQLADRLGITDKAVSKWERGVCYPDITLLRTLADALEVTVSELLAGQRDEAAPVPSELTDVVLDTVSYAETARRKNSGWRFWLFVALTAGCLIAALVLSIILLTVDSGHRQAMLLAIKCVAFGWALCCPLLRSAWPVRDFLLMLSFAIVPFLTQFPGWYWTPWIALLSVIYLWAVYFICRRWLRQRLWLAAGWSLLLCVPLSFGILCILASRGIYGSLANITIAALSAGACFLLDFVLHRRERE